MAEVSLQSKIDLLTEEQIMIQDSAASFMEQDGELGRVRECRFSQPGYQKSVWKEIADLGWLGLTIPENYGGMGMGFSELVLLVEQMGKGLLPEPYVATVVLAGGAILNGDNETAKKELLGKLVEGDWIPALAWQEGRASMTTEAAAVTASGSGDQVTLSGQKVFVPGAGGADSFVVSAKTSGGTALYLVSSDAQGVSLDYAQRVDGGYYATLTLDNAKAESCIASAAIGQGVLDKVIDEARVATSAELLGVMTRALEISVDYISQRVQFGKPIGSFQALQHKSVDLFILSEISRSVVIQTATTFDDESSSEKDLAAITSRVKARCSDAALQITKDSIQLHGGIGYTDECNIGLYLKKAMLLSSWLGNATYHRKRYADLVVI